MLAMGKCFTLEGRAGRLSALYKRLTFSELRFLLLLHSPQCTQVLPGPPCGNWGLGSQFWCQSRDTMLSFSVSPGDEGGQWNTGRGGQLQSHAIKWQSVLGEWFLVSVQELVPETTKKKKKKNKYSKIGCHTEHQKLLQPIILELSTK